MMDLNNHFYLGTWQVFKSLLDVESYFASDFAIGFAKQALWKQIYVTSPLIFDTYTPNFHENFATTSMVIKIRFIKSEKLKLNFWAYLKNIGQASRHVFVSLVIFFCVFLW